MTSIRSPAVRCCSQHVRCIARRPPARLGVQPPYVSSKLAASSASSGSSSEDPREASSRGRKLVRSIEGQGIRECAHGAPCMHNPTPTPCCGASPGLIAMLCGASQINPKEGGPQRIVVCPVCRGTGFKACGQCEGTGVNQEEKFGSPAGAPCWLCEGVSKTICGNCLDLTDEF